MTTKFTLYWLLFYGNFGLLENHNWNIIRCLMMGFCLISYVKPLSTKNLYILDMLFLFCSWSKSYNQLVIIHRMWQTPWILNYGRIYRVLLMALKKSSSSKCAQKFNLMMPLASSTSSTQIAGPGGSLATSCFVWACILLFPMHLFYVGRRNMFKPTVLVPLKVIR